MVVVVTLPCKKGQEEGQHQVPQGADQPSGKPYLGEELLEHRGLRSQAQTDTGQLGSAV